MKIPGLDEITDNMDKFASMLPVLESIDNNLRVLAAVMIEDSSLHYDQKQDFMDRMS